MLNAWLLLPDLLLIVIGAALCRFTALGRPIWDAVERLVYYLLFPVLLFNSILKSALDPQQTFGLASCGVATVLFGITLAYATRLWPGVDARLHAAGAQTAFRFNSFIALALAERLQGVQGVAWMALIIALCVPLCNIAAVWPLARHGGHAYGRELVRNPLIVATVAGLLANLAGVRLPAPVDTTLQRIGLAALPLGLMAVGCGPALRWPARVAWAGRNAAGDSPCGTADLCARAVVGSEPERRAAHHRDRLRGLAHRAVGLRAGAAHGRQWRVCGGDRHLVDLARHDQPAELAGGVIRPALSVRLQPWPKTPCRSPPPVRAARVPRRCAP